MSIVSIVVLLTLCGVVQATVLTGVGGNTNVAVPADHGSNVQDTQHIALTWAPTGGAVNSRNQWEQYNNWPGGGDGGAVYQVDSAIEHTIAFAPEAGYGGVLTSLDLNVWSGGGDTNVNWAVTGSLSGLLGSGIFFTSDGSVVTHSINLVGNGSETLTLSLQQTSGNDSYLAMDNLTFSEVVVPEPATLALLGLGGMAIRRRRA
ncbi:MAG: PEP-CTERM sorting domain-containing protein [Anaerohalosphaeraceae bacterium]